MPFTGKDLISLGYEPGPWFRDALHALAQHDPETLTQADVEGIISQYVPPPMIEMREEGDHVSHISYLRNAESGTVEHENSLAVEKAMKMIGRIPTVRKMAVMPDACPAGTIPVGGVVATKDAIHPGYHSADVCCSMAMTEIDEDVDPKFVLDQIEKFTHFGPSRRTDHPIQLREGFTDVFKGNPFLDGLEEFAKEGFTTQGDGNHFYFVGFVESTGKVAIVSHHGSRKLGARVYSRGLAAARRVTAKIAPSVPKAHCWLDTKTELGEAYWNALQVVRQWTKENHFDLHDFILKSMNCTTSDRFWNPHNFVFQRAGYWVHAKGATPSYSGHSGDDDGRTLIPMNMEHPILITRHTNIDDAIGFAPHGAGRNMSRTQYMKTATGENPDHIDFRAACGPVDPSELPAAYKNPGEVIGQIRRHNLANIVDRVIPYGSIMAGHIPFEKRKKKVKK